MLQGCHSQWASNSCNFEYDSCVKPVHSLPVALRCELPLGLGDSSTGTKKWRNECSEGNEVEELAWMSEAIDFEYSDTDCPTESAGRGRGQSTSPSKMHLQSAGAHGSL